MPILASAAFDPPSLLRRSPNDAKNSVPIPAIVGGAIGGALLALLLVLGWRCWGRSIRREQLKALDKRASSSLAKSSLKTAPRPSSSSSASIRTSHTTPQLPAPILNEKRVTFASPGPTPPPKAAPSRPAVMTGTLYSSTPVSRFKETGILNKPDRSVRPSQRDVLQHGTRRSRETPRHLLQQSLSNGGSRERSATIGTRRSRGHSPHHKSSPQQRWSRLLGIPSQTDQNSDGLASVASTAEQQESSQSRWRVLPRAAERNRASFMTATSASVYSDHGPDPVGLAYGGEEYEFIDEETDHELRTSVDTATRLLEMSHPRSG